MGCLALLTAGLFLERHYDFLLFAEQLVGTTSLALILFAAFGTLYALIFALIGIKLRPQKSLNAAQLVLPEADAVEFLVLIPAHNEGHGLVATVESVLAQDYAKHKIRCVVIADNCTDDTAEVASRTGAQVLIRTQPKLRGKGHALAWAISSISKIPWDAICILDADSVISPGFFLAMGNSLLSGNQVVQGRYEFEPPTSETDRLQQLSAITKAGESSFVHRPRSYLGLILLLQGNGFCVSREALRRVPWKAVSIVEDAEYALALEQAGIPVQFEEQAQVVSRQPSTVSHLQPQRVRWASGTWHLFRRAIPALLGMAIEQRSLRPLEGIAMLVTTSRMLLIYLIVLSLLLAVGASAMLAHLVWSIAGAVLALQLLYMLLMFRFAGPQPISPAVLLRAPYYLAVIAGAQALALFGFNRGVWSRTVR